MIELSLARPRSVERASLESLMLQRAVSSTFWFQNTQTAFLEIWRI
jgi:hypothetical protein